MRRNRVCQERSKQEIQNRTVDHVLHRFWVIFAEIDDPRDSLAEGAATGSVEETGSQAYDGSMHGVRLLSADYGEVRVLANFQQSIQSQKESIIGAFVQPYV